MNLRKPLYSINYLFFASIKISNKTHSEDREIGQGEGVRYGIRLQCEIQSGRSPYFVSPAFMRNALIDSFNRPSPPIKTFSSSLSLNIAGRA